LRAQRAIASSNLPVDNFVSQQLAADFLGATEYAELTCPAFPDQ